MPTKSNPDIKLTIPQATADTRHGIVKLIKRMIAVNRKNQADSMPIYIDGEHLIEKILKMDERAKLKPGGEGQRRVPAKTKK